MWKQNENCNEIIKKEVNRKNRPISSNFGFNKCKNYYYLSYIIGHTLRVEHVRFSPGSHPWMSHILISICLGNLFII